MRMTETNRNVKSGVVTGNVPAGVFLMTDLLLGLGMLFMVFDDSRARTERLAVINSLTGRLCRDSVCVGRLVAFRQRCHPLVPLRPA